MAATGALTSVQRARAQGDQVAQLYDSWHRTSLSMLFGAAILKALNVHSRSQVVAELAKRGIGMDFPDPRLS